MFSLSNKSDLQQANSNSIPQKKPFLLINFCCIKQQFYEFVGRVCKVNRCQVEIMAFTVFLFFWSRTLVWGVVKDIDNSNKNVIQRQIFQFLPQFVVGVWSSYTVLNHSPKKEKKKQEKAKPVCNTQNFNSKQEKGFLTNVLEPTNQKSCSD